MMSALKFTEWTPEYFNENRAICNGILRTSEVLEEIPLLNNAPLHNFRDQQLVRFQGMIQDMHNPEYYFKQYEVRNTNTDTCQLRNGMYIDSARCLAHEEILFESEKNQSSERYTCFVISTPGLNDWAKEKCKQLPDSNVKVTNIYKRSLDTEDIYETMDCSEPTCKKEKILIEDNEKMETTESDTKQQHLLSKEYILNFPIPDDDGKACIVKVYEEEPLKLNEIIEILGFISLDPLLNSIYNSDETMTEAEMSVHHPPASLVPRLHAIKVIRKTTEEIKSVPEIISKAELIRSDLHLILSQLLFGDHLAADYLICHLLSSIYMRRDFFCLGSYPLNITHFPLDKYGSFVKDLYKFLTLFLKKSHLLEITLENLNDLTLSPKKDYECNRLTSGVLQLSDHTHLIIDETGLTTGQITGAGRENYNVICNLVNFQRVTYDFKYYKMEYDTDIPVLILSEAKSFIPCQTQVILKIDAESENLYPQVMEIAEQYLKDKDRMTNIRQYIEVLRNVKFEISEDIVKDVQSDFIQMRQTKKHVSVDDLHTLMILARLLSLSHGSNILTKEVWKRAVQMEVERLSRLPEKK